MDSSLMEIYTFCKKSIENNTKAARENPEGKWNLASENEAYTKIIYLIRKLVKESQYKKY